MWECPQFFEVDGHHVMMTSVMDAGSLTHSIYALGEWVDGQFSAKAWGQLSFGTSYYAPSFFRDAKGQPSVLFWMRNIGGTGDGWIGAHSLPFRLQVTNGALVARPSEALVGYRGDLSPTGQVDGLAADVLWSSAGTLTIRSGGVEVASVVVKDSTLTLSCDGESWSMPQGASDIRVILDGPVLEVISETGLIGCPVTPAGSNLEFSIDGGQVSVWPLRHPATH
jgi:beta-fructofuranosidase